MFLGCVNCQPTIILLNMIHDVWTMFCLFHDTLVFRHSQILVTNTARRLVVIDVERGDQELCYDNCEFLLWCGNVYRNSMLRHCRCKL